MISVELEVIGSDSESCELLVNCDELHCAVGVFLTVTMLSNARKMVALFSSMSKLSSEFIEGMGPDTLTGGSSRSVLT